MKKFLISAAMFFAFSLQAIEIEGNYIYSGYNPYVKSKYIGTAMITKGENGVYQGEWVYGHRKYSGTGIRKDNIVSFVISGPAIGAKFGETELELLLAVYTIDGNQLNGNWVRIGQSLVGTEKLEKKH